MTAILCLSINIGINILIAYLFSLLINTFLEQYYFFLRYFIIIILFLYNYYILRKIAVSWLFEWQFPFQIFSIYKERQIYLAYLKLRLKVFLNLTEKLLSDVLISEKDIEDIKTFLILFNEEFNIYDQLHNIVTNNLNNNNLIRYKMSSSQITYYNLLTSINNALKENNIKDFLLGLKSGKNKISDENKNSFDQLNILLRDFQKTIDKYDWNNYTYMSPAYLYNLLFNDTFGSLSLYSLQFKKKYENYELEENFTPNGKIHYTLLRKKRSNNIENINNNDNNDIQKENDIIISKDSKNENDGALLIFCLPNGGCYELIPKIKVEFYLTHGFSFLCWNYRGYGYSEGRANFSNVKKDVLELYDIVVNDPKYHFTKIAVMGHSIGGVAACYLAKNRYVDLLISDRNFCDIIRLANNIYCGQLLSSLLTFFFIGKTDNINNFFNKMKNDKINGSKNENKNAINKIIIYSPTDMLILNDSTLKSGVSRYIIKNYIIYKNNENNAVIKNKENFLDIVFNKNDKTRFINNFRDLVHTHYEKMNDFYNIDIKKMKKQGDDKIEEKKKIEETFNETQTLFQFFDKFYGICCDNLNYLSAHRISARRETIFIDNFFNNLLIWGVLEEVNECCEFHSEKGMTVLKEAYEIFNKNKLNKEVISPVASLINMIKQDLEKIINVMDNLDIVNQGNVNEISNDISIDVNNHDSLKEHLISDKNESDSDTIITTSIKDNNNSKNNSKKSNVFYDKLNGIKGNIKLFKTMTGHNGLLRLDEREQYFTFLLYSGIIS